MRARPGRGGGQGPYRAAAVGCGAAPTPAWPPERVVPKPPAQPVMRPLRRAPGCRWLAEGCASPTTDSLGLVQSRGGRNLSPEAGAAREPRGRQESRTSAALQPSPTCLPWSATCAPGRPEFSGGDWVWSRWGSCSDSVTRTVLRSRESPDLGFRFRREKSDDPQSSLFCARASLTLHEGCLNRCHTLATPRVLFLTW